MQCDEFRRLIRPYIFDEGVIEEKVDNFEEHYGQCKSCWDIFSAELDIANMLEDAVTEIQKKQKQLPLIKIYAGAEEKKYVHKKNYAEIKIEEPTNIIIKFPGQPDFEHRTTTEELFQIPIAASSSDAKDKNTVFETEHLIIEITKGKYAGTMTIKVK